MKRMYNVVPSQRIQKALPPMTESEQRALYDSIVRDGIMSPLVVGHDQNILVNGCMPSGLKGWAREQ